MKLKLTSLEKKWILYDVANSAFILLVTTIMPIYFNSLAESGGLSDTQYLTYWANAVSAATLISAILGPFVGRVTDKKGLRKPMFVAAILIGVIGCFILGLMNDWYAFLVIFVLARVAYSLGNVIYDSMLPDITTEERFDEVSSQGFAWGYIGSVIPFILGLLLIFGADRIGITSGLATSLAFIITAIWWFVLSLPLIKDYKHIHYRETAGGNPFKELFNTLKEVVKDKVVFVFLLAFFFYIDGVQTIINMATSYGAALGLDSAGLLLALLVTQFVAFPSTLIIGRLSKKIKTEYLISICIAAYLVIVIIAIEMTTLAQFWVLAVMVGLFQGGIQALSRSYFTKLIPKEKSGAYFGLYDIFGKGASFIGTTTISIVTSATGNARLAIATIAIYFIIGLVLFWVSVRLKRKETI